MKPSYTIVDPGLCKRDSLLAVVILCIVVAVIIIAIGVYPAHAAPLDGSIRIGCPPGQYLVIGYLTGPRFQPVEVLDCWSPRRIPRMGAR